MKEIHFKVFETSFILLLLFYFIEKINSLNPDLEDHIKDIFKKINAMRGAQIKCS